MTSLVAGELAEGSMAVDDEIGARARARVGTVLRGKYRLDGVLGIGGMAAVFSATHLRNANRVAVKILHHELAIEPNVRARFLREGYAANSVGHPGTVRILDDDRAEDGSIFLVMDLIDGETLDARWERNRRRLPVAEVVAFMQELLDVLSAAHEKGIVHRDLKPENLFVTLEGRLKVLDFGIARLREASPTRTTSRAVLGTPAFMPPEQALGRAQEVDAISDIWAVGATAFSLLTGRFVHEGDTTEELLVQAATLPAPPLASIAPDVPTPIADVIDRALAFDKADRWRSARAMQDALARAQGTWADADVDDHGGDDKTDIGLPPQMTLPGSDTPSMPSGETLTAALPDLPRPSTIAGVITPSEARRAQSRKRRTAIGIGAGGLLVTMIFIGIVASVVASPNAKPAAPGASTSAPMKAVPTSRVEAPSATIATPPATNPIDEPAVISVEELPRAVIAVPVSVPPSVATTPTLRASASSSPLVAATPLSERTAAMSTATSVAPVGGQLPPPIEKLNPYRGAAAALSPPPSAAPRSSAPVKRDPLAPDDYGF